MLIDLINDDAGNIRQQNDDAPEQRIELCFERVLISPEREQHPVDHEEQNADDRDELERQRAARDGGGAGNDINAVVAASFAVVPVIPSSPCIT